MKSDANAGTIIFWIQTIACNAVDDDPSDDPSFHGMPASFHTSPQHPCSQIQSVKLEIMQRIQRHFMINLTVDWED